LPGFLPEQNGEGFVANEVARNEHGMAETEGLFLARVADLHHIADAANHFRQILFSSLFEKTLEHRSVVKMILDGVLAFSGDDDDVLDAGGDAFFGDILNLRFVNDREHFFWLSLGGGKETRPEAGGGQDRFADFAHGRRVRRRSWWIGRHYFCEVLKSRVGTISFAQ
jgi:hypothetical protein